MVLEPYAAESRDPCTQMNLFVSIQPRMLEVCAIETFIQAEASYLSEEGKRTRLMWPLVV